MDLKGRSLLTLLDYTPDEIEYLLELAAELEGQDLLVPREVQLPGVELVSLAHVRASRYRSAWRTVLTR